MTVGIKVGRVTDEIGTGDFLHAFFSTVSGNLEDRWGERFPVLMNQLYQGTLAPDQASAGLAELDAIRSALAGLAVDRVIWDIEDRKKQPPWGDKIAPRITDLSCYFVTSTGRDLIALFEEALRAARDENTEARIVQC